MLGRITSPFRSQPVEPYPIDQALVAAADRLTAEAAKLREALTDVLRDEYAREPLPIRRVH